MYFGAHKCQFLVQLYFKKRSHYPVVLTSPTGLFEVCSHVTLKGKMGMQPILPVTLPVKKIKGAARQYYGDDDRAIWCKQTFTRNVFSPCPLQIHFLSVVLMTIKRTHGGHNGHWLKIVT